MSELYDLLIIGAGPGGLSAGIYGSRAKLKTAILDKNAEPGGQATTTEELENYPGFFNGSTGPGIMKKFAEHAKTFGTEFLRGTVDEVDFSGPVKKVHTQQGDTYESKVVILSPGANPRKINVKGEAELRGKGVSYCATCDADFFVDLDVVVVGNGDAAIEEAMYLTKFAATVTVIVIHEKGNLDCNKASAEKAMKNPKLKWVWNSTVEEIAGDELVEKVVLKNIDTGELSDLETNGVFVFIGTVPHTDFLKGKVDLDDRGYIITNDMMETNVPGVYGVGDARVKYLRQVVTAASDGAIASSAAEKYLSELETLQNDVLDVSKEKPVLLAFWAPQIQESIDSIAAVDKVVEGKNDQVGLVKLDTYRAKKTATQYKVDQIPTVVLFKDDKDVGRISGADNITPEAVEALLK
ncbi:thioredoxin-disulfide reductase [Companilactobacillus versmoldensis]|uniref:Thioredoxin reductase n=1 Tax=Companilactobacillus versmoldensis DSM 14857 = KCTC 3814 TaxID=1423815 RepID=A0A0R1SCK3_9LACO|nr:thioredoxin-disulfide reductase [Companilactobacillus versmoldensis]KRL67318.1 thioredoxin reductase [Companilactobacillus versmoldensis DSM 14857 = KCTC 3814]